MVKIMSLLVHFGGRNHQIDKKQIDGNFIHAKYKELNFRRVKLANKP
jgi:hypothetical protein